MGALRVDLGSPSRAPQEHATRTTTGASHDPTQPRCQRKELAPWGSGGSPPRTRTGDAVRALRGHTSPEPVEVPGIEPGSSVASTGLLRAQFTMPLLGPTDHVN